MNTRRLPHDGALTVIALTALACIVGSMATASLVGLQTPYAAGCAVVVGIGAVVSGWVRSHAARVATAIFVLGLILIRMVSATLPEVFTRPHGVPSLLDGVGMVLLLAAAVTLLMVELIRR